MQRRSHFSPEPTEARVQNDSGRRRRVLGADDRRGRQLLDEVASVRSIGPADLARFRKRAAPGVVAAAVRLAMRAGRPSRSSSAGERMWVEATGVEQATAEPVARHKAGRFESCPIVVDLCAGIGGDTIALAARSRSWRWISIRGCAGGSAGMPRSTMSVIGSWRFRPGRRPSRSLVVHGSISTRIAGLAAIVELVRRGLRAWPSAWESIVRSVPGGAIKLSPASDFARHLPGPGYEIELISLRGECKEATVWFGELAGCRRRATRLPEGVTWTDRDGGRPGPVPISPLSNWIYDPDPALIRAGLVDGFAQAHGLCRVAGGVDYLTAAVLVATPFLAAFAVRDVSSMDLKHLRRMIERHRVGTLEIKVRGADVAPEALRSRLRPRGAESATLLIVGGTGPARAVLAQRG